MFLEHFSAVAPEKAYRMFNLGATALVGAEHMGVTGLMPATWVCPLDLVPFKATAVVARNHFTRPLIEKSGCFALMIPTVSIVETVMKLGTVSKFDDPEKIEKSGAGIFNAGGYDIPLVKGCAGWAIFKVVSEPHNEQAYDLFIGECEAAWSDARLFKDGHWFLETAPLEMRPLHYVAGGHWYATGQAVTLPHYGNE